MLLKIDENLHAEAAELLRQHGHDAITVHEQGLQGRTDNTVATVCRQENRAVVTLDLDFSDIRNYPPQDYSGIIVLRPHVQSRPAALRILRRVIPLLDTEPLSGHLWIVDEHQVRIRGGDPSAGA